MPPFPTFSHSGFQGWIGVSREEITPPVGIYARNWGAASHDTAAGVHRPLTATALTLQQGSQDLPLVVVSLDLGWWRSYRDEWHVRGHLLSALALPSERVMLAFTHTHAGPALNREEDGKPGSDRIAPYLDALRETLVRAVHNALAGAAPATLEWRYGKCGLAANRDLCVEEGAHNLREEDGARYVCGFNPSLPADDTLLVGRVTGQNGQIVATLVNYACHPTTLGPENRLLSPDYVGALREVVEAQTGHAPCLFLQGASGELAPREQYTADTILADAQGTELGYAALSTLTGMLPPRTQLTYAGMVESGATLGLWKREPKTMSAHLAAIQTDVEFTLQSLPTLAELDAELAACTNRVQQERLARKRRIREGVGDSATAKMPFWAWQVGEAVLVGHPNEAYSLLQTVLRERFSERTLAVMNVVNGHYGYLPPASLYDAPIYAVWQSPFGRGSLEHLLEACEKTIRSLMEQRP